MRPELTVIVPVYNGSEFLPRCLNSIIKQTFTDMEIIVVDNKSTDNTGNICDLYAQKDKRIKVIHREEHGWICDSRNEGITVATGKWITFVDADDWLEPDCYRTILRQIADDNIDIFCEGGRYENYSSKSVLEKHGLGTFYCNTKKQKRVLLKKIIEAKSITTTTISLAPVWDKLYRLDFLKKNNLFFPTDILYADDLFFNLLAFEKATHILGSDYTGYHYWINPDSVTHKFRPEWPEQITHFLKRVEANLRENNLYLLLNEVFHGRVLISLLNVASGTYFNSCNKESYFTRRRKFNTLKKEDIFQRAIWSDVSKYTLKAFVFVHILRTPFCLPFVLFFQYRRRRRIR